MNNDPRVFSDPDYIHSPKHKNSLAVFMNNHQDGATDEVICRVLCIDQQKLDLIYLKVIDKLKKVFF
jgi:hypothetical protein